MYKKIFIASLFLFFFLFYSKPAFASTLYLSPAGGNIGTGNVIYVQIRLNAGGDSVNGVSAYLSYPSDKIDVVSMSYGGSFGIAAEGSYGGGGVRISRGNISGVGGDVNIATMGIRGKTTGSATISFIGGSAAARASDSSDSLSGSSGGIYTVVQGTVQPKTPGGNQQPLPETPKDTTKPVITDLKVASTTTNSATITWKTNENTDSVIEYGLDANKYFLSTTDTKLTTDHVLKIESPVLTPDVKIHFRVLAKDQAGNVSTGNDMEVQITGYSVNITVTDKQNKSLQNAEVLLYSDPQKTTTDAKGVASFKNVTAGKHLVVVKYKGAQTTQEINVKDTLSTQAFTVNIQVSGTNLLVFIVVLILILLILGSIIINKEKIKIFKQPPPNPTAINFFRD